MFYLSCLLCLNSGLSEDVACNLVYMKKEKKKQTEKKQWQIKNCAGTMEFWVCILPFWRQILFSGEIIPPEEKVFPNICWM